MEGIIAAYGLPGYGPSDPENYRECETWPQLADTLREMLQESADSAGDIASSLAEQGDYEQAWKTRESADSMYNLADNLNNNRQNAPLYQGKPDLWAETIQRIVSEHFPYDTPDGSRIYVWEDEISDPDQD